MPFSTARTRNGPNAVAPPYCSVASSRMAAPGRRRGARDFPQKPVYLLGTGRAYMNSGMYGHVRIARERAPECGTAAAQTPGAKFSVYHGAGGMFAGSSTAILSNVPS